MFRVVSYNVVNDSANAFVTRVGFVISNHCKSLFEFLQKFVVDLWSPSRIFFLYNVLLILAPLLKVSLNKTRGKLHSSTVFLNESI